MSLTDRVSRLERLVRLLALSPSDPRLLAELTQAAQPTKVDVRLEEAKASRANR